jgi:hypothetical protein
MNVREKTTDLSRQRCYAALCLFAALGVFGQTLQAVAQTERFEVSSMKAVRPALVDTIAGLQKGDLAGARAAFDAYDSLWNGIEVYVNTRSKDIYDTLEHGFQARIEKAFGAPTPDVATLLSEAKAMLVKYDETIDFVSKSPPLNPLYDDIARLRIVRAHLREVVPALKAGNFDKARKSFSAFDNTWDSIEDMVKAHSADDYVAIEKGMIEIEKALMPEKPDLAAATALVNAVMAKYNATLAALAKEARSRP